MDSDLLLRYEKAHAEIQKILAILKEKSKEAKEERIKLYKEMK